ncbi:MAG: hypothetical protein KIT87_18795 [Anaerolineae bacterium]|nr:hypothetical protein [Anaerolineae bacterium]
MSPPSEPTFLSTSALHALNPAAGEHALPSDPREMEAALRASERSWRRFPYLAARYGERGRQFTGSDSAWIVTLRDFDQTTVDRNILWLADLLSHRGMPRWILEVHLGYLVEELMQAAPEKAPVYERVRQAAERLAAARRRAISDSVTDRLVAAFDVDVAGEAETGLGEAGRLIVAAVTDEADGVVHAVSSLESWLTEPTRFSPRWQAAVRTTIAQARAAAH